ncbi:hypothetical protein SAY87_029068 [Trapa incisa]|uniref:Scarecrow-like protein 15 n=1 Tax=Trapa incisa TaxID=236973 RepID=A0AAN7QPD2_9MYRT|nr:hypothetical protein SAY87_029068 [Trapa incisa]
MRVPSTVSEHQNNPSLKPNISISVSPITTAASHLGLCSYEPTSVLDLGSPVSSSDLKHPRPAARSDITSTPPPSYHGWDDDDGGGGQQQLHALDWDSIMKDLDFHDDVSATAPLDSNHFTNTSELGALSEIYGSAGQLCFPHVPYTNYGYFDHGGDHLGNNWALGFDFLEEFEQAAECVDSGELQLAQVILARLNHRLRSPVGKPLDRAGFFFKEVLQSLVSGSNRTPSAARLSTWSDVVYTIQAHKAFSGISPISMFSHFTANQAILETLADGSPLIHIVDFDVGLGGQYSSLMCEVAQAARASHPPAIRVSAIVSEGYAVESCRLIRENLAQFALELGLRFNIDFLLSFKAIEFVHGEDLAVLLSAGAFHRLGSAAHVARFLGDLRRLSPKVVFYVDSEPWWGVCSRGLDGSGSFRRSFMGSLEHYSTVFDSLDAAAGYGSGVDVDWMRKIETYIMQPRIASAVEAAASVPKRAVVPPCKEVLHAAGMRPVQLSHFAGYLAECLLGKVEVRGFHVAKRQSELVLYWHDRVLVATSAWRF